MEQNTQHLSIIPLGGVGDVTRNMYVYQYQDEILLVDCGLGFADETMLGVDLLIPDITYVETALKQGKHIVGMLITHGHEDHMGALPFILPQLPQFPIYATPLTAALANRKLGEFGISQKVQPVEFTSPGVKLGSFSAEFIRVTHSVPDTSHIFIKTPIGNIYHGSDYKFDLTPFDGKRTDFAKIAKAGEEGVVCLLSDTLGAERPGITPSEINISAAFEREIKDARGKVVVTTYSSHINRLNQVIAVAKKYNKHIAFIGRSLISTVDVAKMMGLISMPKGMEIRLDQIKNYKDSQIILFVAGSQGQENSAMTRLATGELKDVKLSPLDTVIFSSDPIPGNEIMVNSLVNTIAKVGSRVLYSEITRDFHVSGHGSAEELLLLMELVRPKKMIPIGGNYKHMVAYQKLAMQIGYSAKDVFLPEDGQEIIFTKTAAFMGQKYPSKKVYVDEMSGEEVEGYVLRDRQKLSQDGVVAIMVELDPQTGRIVDSPDVVMRGFGEKDGKDMKSAILDEMKKLFSGQKGKVNNFVYIRQLINEAVEKRLYREFRKRPLILPVVIEV